MLDTFIGYFNGAVAIVVLFGACVLFHEVGHYVSAKLIGMRVHEFGVGFGRRLWGCRRGETEYRLNLIPLGGYVRIAGMEPGAQDEPGGFYSFPRWKGAIVLLAGSFMNVVLAALAFILITIAAGVPVFPGHTVSVRKVLPDSPAEAAGLRAGDEIVAIDGMDDSLLVESVQPGGLGARLGLRRYTRLYEVAGQPIAAPPELVAAMIAARAERGDDATLSIKVVHFDDEGTPQGEDTINLPLPADLPEEARAAEAGPFLERILGVTFAPLDQDSAVRYISERPNQRLMLDVKRDGQIVRLAVVPRAEWERVPETNEQGQLDMVRKSVGRIGVVLGGESRPATLREAVTYGVTGSVQAVYVVAVALSQMVTGEIVPQASGPVGIAAEAVDRARIGWTSLATFLGILSANLAVINLFPFPPFDGFRIVLLGIEGIMRRRVNEKVEIAVTLSGVAVILGLFVYITFKDVFNLVVFQSP